MKLRRFIWWTSCGGSGAASDEVDHQRHNSQEKEQMNQSASGVKHQEAPSPGQQKQERDQEKRPKSHNASLLRAAYGQLE
jgi:hypothetical protein